MPSLRASAEPKRDLTLEAILDASIRIADEEGLGSVSIRRVASELGGRPMSLYRFIASKDDLVARMLDIVMDDTVISDLPADWRTAIVAVARRTIEVGARHRWIIAAGMQTDEPGPRTLAHAMQTVRALESAGAAPGRAQSFATAIDVYTIGFATITGAGLGEAADERVFSDGINWLLDGFERELRGQASRERETTKMEEK